MKTIIVVVILIVILLVGFSSSIGSRNQMVTKNEAIKSAWAQVDNVLQRRADLIPNLVETVKGIATQEQVVFGDIAKAHLFLGGDSFDGLDQVGDQVGATLQYVIHLGPCGFYRFVFRHHLVARADGAAKTDQQ